VSAPVNEAPDGGGGAGDALGGELDGGGVGEKGGLRAIFVCGIIL